jgi:16S rRNA processing protein RimM
LEPLEEGECYQGDLVGLRAIDEGGRAIGTVEEVWNTGPVPNLVIRGPDDLELLIPLVDEFVPAVDLDAGTVVVRTLQFTES